MRFLPLLLLFGCSLFAAQTAVSTPTAPSTTVTKKLLEFGWDKPLPNQISTAQLEGSLFDGVAFRPTTGDRVIIAKKLPVADFDGDIAALKKIQSVKLKNSFYVINANTETWDWFDDTAWEAALQNLTQFARVAKEGGLRGLVIDPEVYEFDLWAYASQPQKAQHNFAAFEAQLRKRGADAMRAMERVYPGITILSLHLYGALEIPTNATYEAAHASLETDGFLGLYAAFVEGMLEAATAKAVLIDGNEGSYYHVKSADFDSSRQGSLNATQLFVRPDLRDKAKRQIRVANAIFVDGVMNLFDSARFFGYYLKNDDERRALIAHNVYHGLRAADEFVWVYSENMNWWKRSINTPTSFTALEASVGRGRDQQRAGTALGSDPTAAIAAAKTAFDARVNVGGDITGRTGLSIDFGALKNHCGIWNNAQRWSCTQPGSSSFTVTPTAAGVTFTPGSRSFTNQQKDDWNVNFAVK